MRYPSKELIKNITPVARSISEANRDAQYCCAIQTFKSDTKLTLDFIANAALGFLWITAVAGAVVGVVYWFIK